MPFYWARPANKNEKARIRKEKHKRIHRLSQISARGGVEQRLKDRYALFQLITQQTRPTTTKGYEYTLVE